MHSVRVRIAIVAAALTAIAVAVTAVLLLGQLQSSLRAEIVDSVEDQVFDYQQGVREYNDIFFARLPNDAETLYVVVTAAGDILDANDTGIDGNELAGLLDLADTESGDSLYVFEQVSLSSPTELVGQDQLYLAYGALELTDNDDTIYVIFARSTGSVDRVVSPLRRWMLVVVPLLGIFVGLLAWWLTGRSLRPVDRMRQEVDEITSTDLAMRVSEPASTDEIGQLATTMNQMLERLEWAKKGQDQFVSDAAHELRTPLASIAAQLDVDAAHPDSADQLVTAANVRVEVQRLQSLIDALLRSARGQQKSEPLTGALLDLDVLVGESAARMAIPAHLVIDQTGVSAAEVRGDAVAYASLIDNLFANAVRHAASQVQVSVGASAAESWLRVDDDGNGIAPADRERVFARFVRLDEARTADRGGSGLGLALARETAELYGGSLTAGESPLGGARFELRLPAVS